MSNALELLIKISVDDQSVQSDLKEVSSDIEQVGEASETAGKKGKSMGALMVAAGEVMAQAFLKACQVAKDLAKQAVETALEMETAFAKVDSIATYSMDAETAVGQSSEAMRQAIIDLSNQYGISTAEIGDSIYGMISATGDTAHAVENVEQATKLAVAGFTDASSAASVLATAMNAYGDSAGTVEQISDSLIATQNLGVTTVAELSAQMGKAIATGSAYGVNLTNLEAGYVALTKSGIGTAEATTYLSSMMNELGKNGTKVSDTLKKTQGKTFGELMASGKDLADVMEILYDSVNYDAEAFANLWGSAEAGKGALAIVNQGFDEWESWMEQIGDSAGATQEAFETMSDTTQFKIDQIKETMKNLSAQGISPLVDAFGGLLGSLMNADWSPLLEPLEDARSKLIDIIDNIDWDSITENINILIQGIADFGHSCAEIMIPAIEEMKEAFEKLDEAFSPLTDLYKEWKQDNEDVSIVMMIAKEMVQALADGIKILGFTIQVFATAVQVAIGVINGFVGVVKMVIQFVQLMAQTFQLIIQTILGVVIATFDQIKTAITDPIQKAYDTVSSTLDNIKQAFTDKMNAAKDAVQTAIETIKGLFDFEWKLPDLKVPHFSVTGGVAPYGLGGKGSLPSISIEWYAKAMDNAVLLNSPTIFGMSNGHLLGGGEAGTEVVAGESHLMDMIAQSVSNVLSERVDDIAEMLYEYLPKCASDKNLRLNKREFARLVNDV